MPSLLDNSKEGIYCSRKLRSLLHNKRSAKDASFLYGFISGGIFLFLCIYMYRESLG